MLRPLALILPLITFSAFPATSYATASDTLSGSEIKQTIQGKRIYLQTPFGGEFPLNYRSNGVVDGDGEALGLGRFVRPDDQGRWWITQNKLCQQWQNWYDGRQFCFTLSKTDEGKLSWHRDDGKSGKARISR